MSMEEREEAAYERGERTAALRIIREALRYVGMDDPIARAVDLASELSAARNAARHVCEDVLGIEYPGDSLNLADVIEKHIGRNIEP